MDNRQPGILPPIPVQSRYLEFSAVPDRFSADSLTAIQEIAIDGSIVIGFGPGLLRYIGVEISGHRAFPALSGPGVEIPSTQADLWVWLRGTERGRILHASQRIEALLSPSFQRCRMVDGFRYEEVGLDLSGYEDGTENPKGQDAIEVAFRSSQVPGLDGSSFVAVQKWQHDLGHFFALPTLEQDHIIGRRRSDNEELDDAPSSAHVKRTAQESFSPEAFVLRRSMPWADRDGEGLNFVAFGKSFEAFEAQLRRMAGLDDGVVDGLFRFSKPLTGGYYWCPPKLDGHLDLTLLGL